MAASRNLKFKSEVKKISKFLRWHYVGKLIYEIILSTKKKRIYTLTDKSSKLNGIRIIGIYFLSMPFTFSPSPTSITMHISPRSFLNIADKNVNRLRSGGPVNIVDKVT